MWRWPRFYKYKDDLKYEDNLNKSTNQAKSTEPNLPNQIADQSVFLYVQRDEIGVDIHIQNLDYSVRGKIITSCLSKPFPNVYPHATRPNFSLFSHIR